MNYNVTSINKGGCMGFDTLSDKERGELDCVLGYPALVNQSTAYEDGYGEQYAKEQNQGSKEQ